MCAVEKVGLEAPLSSGRDGSPTFLLRKVREGLLSREFERFFVLGTAQAGTWPGAALPLGVGRSACITSSRRFSCPSL